MTHRTCNRCNAVKSIDNFSPTSPYKGEPRWRGECKDCNKTNQKKSESAKIAQKKYKFSAKAKVVRKASRDYVSEYQKENAKYHSNPEYKQKRIQKSIDGINRRLESDPVYRTIFYLKNRLRDWVKSEGERKDTNIGNYVGCTKTEFKIHIEKQFKPGMTWENHGEWEIDHIVPIASATSMEEAYKLTHYTNIQPLWKIENREKSDKLDWVAS